LLPAIAANQCSVLPEYAVAFWASKDFPHLSLSLQIHLLAEIYASLPQIYRGFGLILTPDGKLMPPIGDACERHFKQEA
jgi:hypothetical protein